MARPTPFKFAVAMGFALVASIFCGCTTGTTGGNPTPPPTPTPTPTSNVAITGTCPPFVQIGVDSPATYVCKATVTGTTDTTYTMALTGSGDANRATLNSSTGVITPATDPANTGSVTVTFTANADTSKTATATIKVVDWILYESLNQSYGPTIVAADGKSGPTLLILSTNGCVEPAWRYDHLEFVCKDNSVTNHPTLKIYSTDGTQTGTKPVKSIDLGPICCEDANFPQFSPDGTTLVFTGIPHASPQQVYTIGVDGDPNTLKHLYDFQIMQGTSAAVIPRYSPDGKSIFINVGWNVGLMGADGSNPHALTTIQSDRGMFSPGETHLYFNSGGGNSTDGAYLAAPDGGNPKKISSAFIMGVSPDGSRIVLLDKSDPNNPLIRTADWDGSNPSQSIAAGQDPAW